MFKKETWKAHIQREHYFGQCSHSEDLRQVSFLQYGLNILGRMWGIDGGYHSVEEASLPPALHRFLGLTVICRSDLKIEQQINPFSFIYFPPFLLIFEYKILNLGFGTLD